MSPRGDVAPELDTAVAADRARQIASGLARLKEACWGTYDWRNADELSHRIDELPAGGLRDRFREELSEIEVWADLNRTVDLVDEGEDTFQWVRSRPQASDLVQRISSVLDELGQACGHPYDWEPLVDELDELICELPPSTARDQFQEELERCRREGELTQGLLDAYEDVWMSEDSEWARERRERFGLSRVQLIDRAQRKADELGGESHHHDLHQRIREARHDLAAERRTSAPRGTLTRSRECSGRTPVRRRGSRRGSSSDDPDDPEHDHVDDAAHRRPTERRAVL